MPIDPEARQAVTDRNEEIAEKNLEGLLGYGYKSLDRGKSGERKRVEGVLLRTDGTAVALVEVKTLISGGVDPEDGAHFSTLDPRLPTPYDPTGETPLRIRVKPVTFGNLEQHLEKACQQYRETVGDHPQYADLPLVVVLFSDAFGPPLHFIDRRMPQHPEISGLMYLVKNRLQKEALNRESLGQLEERMSGRGMVGLPPPCNEWRYVANPQGLRKVPRDFADQCLEGWPGDPIEADRLDRDTKQAMVDEMARLLPDRQYILRQLFEVGGFASIDRSLEEALRPHFDALVGADLLEKQGSGGYLLTDRGRMVAAVDAAVRQDSRDA